MGQALAVRYLGRHRCSPWARHLPLRYLCRHVDVMRYKTSERSVTLGSSARHLPYGTYVARVNRRLGQAFALEVLMSRAQIDGQLHQVNRVTLCVNRQFGQAFANSVLMSRTVNRRKLVQIARLGTHPSLAPRRKCGLAWSGSRRLDLV